MKFALVLLLAAVPDSAGAAENLLSQAWKRNGLATPRFEIRGTESRSNPLRQPLTQPFDGNELFVRFRLNYAAETIDTPTAGDGEFFVLWLDDREGDNGSTHSNGVPNIGIHVKGDANHLMVRFASQKECFGPRLEGDRDVLMVGRLWKSADGSDQPFDRLDLWADPELSANAQKSPHASTVSANAITAVNWIGFSTGGKTEFEDRISVCDIALATSWHDILNLPDPPPASAISEPVAVKKTVDFSTHVLPVLQDHCFECHSGSDAVEGIRLDVLDEVLNRTAPGDAAGSHLFQLVSTGKMPPEGPRLKDADVKILRAWIDEGLDWDEARLPTPTPESDHWAFQPIRRPTLPEVSDAEWVRTPIDTFIAARHRQHGLTPAPPSDAATLLRRMYLDMLGLPPPANDGDAVDRGGHSDVAAPVETVLANPAHGERWGRHWLDVARWAESNGHQHNRQRPHAWRYRDWVINAFNSDMPYDDFLAAQIAGDELQPASDANIIATGFLSAARYSGNELDKRIQRNDILVDITNTTAQAVLGLTLECAQCHTHKFDPVTIRDYYRFQAFFTNGQPGNVVLPPHSEQARPLAAERWRIFDQQHSNMVASKRRQGVPRPIYLLPKSVVGALKGAPKARFEQLEQQLAELPQSWSYYAPATAGQPLTVAPHVMRWPLPRDPAVLNSLQTALLIRGDVGSPGPIVTPGWPSVFGPTPSDLSKPRTALVKWLTSAENPLTARVWVNRIWQWHFGRGLVESGGDFGTQGTPPTHPDLLDYLASELMDNSWSTHHIHRLILKSATYRQSSAYSEDNAAIDPDNRLLWRWTARRLEAEAIRDCILAVSGQLESKTGGPGVDESTLCRSVYVTQRRNNLPHQQLLFDSATGLTSCSRRRVSTTSLQPLWLLNSDFVQQAAARFAKRSTTIAEAFRVAFGRAPTVDEMEGLRLLHDQHGLASVCLALLNSSEFLYVP